MEIDKIIIDLIKKMYDENKISQNECEELFRYRDFYQFAYEVDQGDYTDFEDFFYQQITRNSSLAEADKTDLEMNEFAMEIMSAVFYLT